MFAGLRCFWCSGGLSFDFSFQSCLYFGVSAGHLVPEVWVLTSVFLVFRTVSMSFGLNVSSGICVW